MSNYLLIMLTIIRAVIFVYNKAVETRAAAEEN